MTSLSRPAALPSCVSTSLHRRLTRTRGITARWRTAWLFRPPKRARTASSSRPTRASLSRPSCFGTCAGPTSSSRSSPPTTTAEGSAAVLKWWWVTRGVGGGWGSLNTYETVYTPHTVHVKYWHDLDVTGWSWLTCRLSTFIRFVSSKETAKCCVCVCSALVLHWCCLLINDGFHRTACVASGQLMSYLLSSFWCVYYLCTHGAHP